MSDVLTLTLPADTTDDEAAALEAELRAIDDVRDAGSMAGLTVDPNEVALWIQAASGLLTAIVTGVPLLQKLIHGIRSRGIHGAKITTRNGVTLMVDEATPAELRQLVEALSDEPGEDGAHGGGP